MLKKRFSIQISTGILTIKEAYNSRSHPYQHKTKRKVFPFFFKDIPISRTDEYLTLAYFMVTLNIDISSLIIHTAKTHQSNKYPTSKIYFFVCSNQTISTTFVNLVSRYKHQPQPWLRGLL